MSDASSKGAVQRRLKWLAGPGGQSQLTRGLGHPLPVIAKTILVFLVSQITGIFVVSLVYGLAKPGTNANFDNSIIAQFFYVLIAEAMAAWLAIKLVRRRRLRLSFIGLGRRPVWRDAQLAAAGFLVFYALLVAISAIINAISPSLNNQSQNLGFTNIHTGFENVLAFIALVILPPLGEETLVRGYLYSGLRKFWRFWPALLVTSLFFGVAHLEFGSGTPLVWAAGADTFVLSIVLCYLREKSGALYAGMAVHMLNNLIAFFVVIK